MSPEHATGPTARDVWKRLSKLTARLSAMLQLLRAAGDAWPLALTAVIVAGGLMPLASVFVTRQVVDGLVATSGSRLDWTLTRPLLVWATAAGLVMLAQQALQTCLTWMRTVYAECLQDHITSRIQEQSTRLDLGFYESSEFFDRLHRARDEATYRPKSLVQSVSDLLQGLITLGAMSFALASFGWSLPGALFVSALPVLFVVARFGLAEQQMRRETAHQERRSWYLEEVLTTAPYAAELRLFDLGRRFRESHTILRGTLRRERLRLASRRGLAELAAGVSGVVVAGAVGIWMLARAASGLISLGQLAASYQAFAHGLTTMRAMLAGVGALYADSVFLDDLTEFLALEPAIRDPDVGAPKPAKNAVGIRFRDVTFRYPGAPSPTLERLNLDVPAGTIAAIVGPNGAGKSTLIKLMARLYDPDSGSIEIDGIDLRRFTLADARSMLTILFQEPVRYWETVTDNVALSEATAGADSETVRGAIVSAGASHVVDRLAARGATVLGRRYGEGAELSTGEWQRIALARAFVRDSPIILLDEPTSALNPWAEADWFGRFRRAAGGRTAILVTHRLSVARRADVIHVIQGGRVAESGTHEHLVGQPGIYAQSVAAAQASEAMRGEPLVAV